MHTEKKDKNIYIYIYTSTIYLYIVMLKWFSIVFSIFQKKKIFLKI